MEPMTIREIAAAVDGVLLGEPGSLETGIARV